MVLEFDLWVKGQGHVASPRRISTIALFLRELSLNVQVLFYLSSARTTLSLFSLRWKKLGFCLGFVL